MSVCVILIFFHLLEEQEFIYYVQATLTVKKYCM